MYTRNVLLSIVQNENVVVFDNGHTALVGRNDDGRFEYRIVYDYPYYESPEIIHNWHSHFNVTEAIRLNGAIYFMEGYNAGMTN